MIITPVRATAQTILAYDYKTAIRNLRGILKRHNKDNDGLSIRLSRWGTSVLQTAANRADNQEEKEDGNEKVINAAHEKIAVLVQEILVNPIDRSPLKEPVLEREMTWEAWMHRDYKTLSPISPLDNGEMLVNPPPHLFAQEMIQWAHDSTPSSGTPALAHFPAHLVALDNGGRKLVPARMEALAKHPQLAETRRWLYQQLAQVVVLKEQNGALREEMEGALVRADECVVQVQQQSQIVIAEAMQRAKAHEAEIRGTIESIDQTHRRELAELNTQMDLIEKTHQETISNFEKRIASVNAANGAVAASLKAEVVAMNQEHQKTITALHNQIHAVNAEHRSAVSALEGKINQANAELSSMSRLHQAEVSNLGEQLSNTAANLQQAQQVIHKERQQNAVNAVEIHNLRNDQASAQGKIATLNQVISELEEEDDDCVIL